MSAIVVHNIEDAPTPRDQELYRRFMVNGERGIDLGKEFELSPGRVSQIVRDVEAWMLGQFVSDAWREKRLQTARLENIFFEAMRGWRRSQEDAVRIKHSVEKSDDADTELEHADSPLVETERIVEGQAGDPRFLETARKALADIRKIWGADEPIKVDLPNGGTVIDVQSQQIAEIEELASILYGPNWATRLLARQGA